MEKKQRRSGRWDIFILGMVTVLFLLLTSLSCSIFERRTPEEIAQIDSMAVELAAAPATSVVKFKDGDLDILERTDEARAYFILNTGSEDYFRTEGIGWLTPEIQEIYTPNHPCHEIMVLNAVDKLAAFRVDSDTVGTRECPQETERTFETNIN